MKTGRLSRSLLGGGLTAVLSVSPLGAASDLPLIQAVMNQDLAAARALVAAGADVNLRQLDGATALHWAVHWEDLEATEFLISAGANVDTANDLRVTPLLMACTSGNAVIVETLLEAGANPRDALSSGETALMLASRAGSVKAVEALLTRGTDVDATEGTRGQTALMWAVANTHPEVTKTLLDHGASVNTRSQVRTRVFNMGGNRSAGGASSSIPLAEVAQGGSTPIVFAARSGDVESAKLLVAAGADVNDAAADGTTVLIMAAHSGHGTLAAYLLGQGADVDAAPAGLYRVVRGGAPRHGARPRRPEQRPRRGHSPRQNVVGAWRRPERAVHERDPGQALEPRLRPDGSLGWRHTVLAGRQVPRDRHHGGARGGGGGHAAAEP